MDIYERMAGRSVDACRCFLDFKQKEKL